MERLIGLMDEYMKDNILMIKCMDMVHFIGLMEENIKVLGKMENNMEKDNIIYLMVNLKLENGLMVKKVNGLLKLKKDNKKFIIKSDFL